MARTDEEKKQRKQRKKHRARRLMGVTAFALVVAAVAQEMNKPAGSRTWTGRVGGLVPYDLRWPVTAERLRTAMWNPDSDAIFTPHAFGVGWSLNFARVASVTRDALEATKR